MIQCLHWYDATTLIHEHAFSGAFRVLRGSSVERVYDWSESGGINTKLRFGALTQRELNVRRPGETVKITPGSTYIHSLFHLQAPTITLIIRTRSEPRLEPQMTYHQPGIARHYSAYREQTQRLASILRRDRGRLMPLGRETLRILLRDLEPNQVFELLGALPEDQLDLSGEVLRQRYAADHVDRLLRGARRLSVEQRFAQMRRCLTEYPHRVILAALWNSADRQGFEALARQCLPEDVHIYALLAEAVEVLVEARMMGFEAEGPGFAAVLQLCLMAKHESDYHAGLEMVFGAEACEEYRDKNRYIRERLLGEVILAPVWA